MAKIVQSAKVEMTLTFVVDEQEARALDALVGYGFDSFITMFYKHLGEHYMKPYEGGLRSFFASIRESVPEYLRRASNARKAFKEEA